MSWRGRGKGSSDLIRRGQAFRTLANESYDPFPESYTVVPPQQLSSLDETLINTQRLIVNHLLFPGNDIPFRVPLTGSDGSLWKRLSSEIGGAYYPRELLTDSKHVALGVPKRAKILPTKTLAELENSENKNEEEASPKSVEDDQQSEASSVGADDYNVGQDFEDEGARDDYDDGGDGGGDYGGEF